jgi:hypothetical protein
MLVQLMYAPLPGVLGLIARHYWFVVRDSAAGRCDRWEVWQSRNAGGESVGHVHCNLMPPGSGVGGGPACLAAEWSGEQACALVAALNRATVDYPHVQRYLAWPGPNSNTFVAWILRRAGIVHPLPWRAFGRSYRA